jgi:hypothetical protein
MIPLPLATCQRLFPFALRGVGATLVGATLGVEQSQKSDSSSLQL